MKRYVLSWAIGVSLFGAAACRSEVQYPTLDGGAPSPPAVAIPIVTFVGDQVAATADNTEPVPVDNLLLSDTQDGHAFDTLFSE